MLRPARDAMALRGALIACLLLGGVLPGEARAEVACVVEVGGAPTGSVSNMHDLRGGGVLIRAHAGWFRYDPETGRVTAAGNATTGSVSRMLNLPDGGVLIGADRGLFRYDAATRLVTEVGSTLRVSVRVMRGLPDGGMLILAGHHWFRYDPDTGHPEEVGDKATGAIRDMRDLADGSVLIAADDSLFRYNPATRRIAEVGGAATGAIRGMRDLPGGVLVGADDGLFRYDLVTERTAEVGNAPTSSVWIMHDLSDDGVLIRARRGWFRYDRSTGRVTEAGDAATGASRGMRNLSNGGVLIEADGGWFRYNPDTKRVEQAGGALLGSVSSMHDLPRGGVLIRVDRHLFRYDPDIGVVAAPGSATMGSIGFMHGLRGGGALIAAERGWFRYDPTAGPAEIKTQVKTDDVTVLHDLPRGGVLIAADRNLFLYDPITGQMTEVGGAATRDVSFMHNLPGGGVLIGTERGLFRGPSLSVTLAEVLRVDQRRLNRERPSDDRISVTVAMRHPCAPVADRLGLSLVAQGPGGPAQTVPARLAHDTTSGPEVAQLVGEFAFDRAGSWTLALRQGTTPVGEPLPFTVAAPTLWERLTAAWQQVATALAILYALAFAALLLWTRRSARAFRILADSAWASWLTWPFFFLRHLPAVQRWVLEPWFQEVRHTVRRDADFLDPPATAGNDTIPASTLLPTLRDARRLWLQGRSGMGKSSVFAAWERAYFAAPNAPTLAAAARRFGFILVTIPVRHYAALPPPEANRPESWVIEAVRRRFEMFGMGELDPALVRAMLRSGHIALALDGLNEADAEGALTAFARQFPQVRLLVTSQTRGGEGWQVWQLPPDVAGMREGLLALWLGPEKAAALDRRLVAEGLSDALLSGYDLRLVADLAGADPDHAAVPADRIALYRAMLSRATDAAGEALRLAPVMKLAWMMFTERRREITADDAKALGGATLKGLTRDGVRILRQTGPLHEFRHDQMRAFLAALWLVEELPGAAAIQGALTKAEAFALPRRDQEEVWRFLAAMLGTEEDLKALWHSANEEPQVRGLLLAALQEEADRRDVTLVRPSRRKKRVEA